MNQTFPMWRSLLFVPAHIDKFVAKAHTRGADAYILDLEDSVPLVEKSAARTRVIDGARQVSRSGAAALVRINHPWRLAVRDLEAVISPTIAAVVLPKVNSGEHVRAISSIIDELETEAGMPPGHTLLIAQIEGADALPHLDAIAASSPRLMAMILGSEDFSASVGMSAIPDGLFAPNQQVLLACRRAGILPLGFPASIADYSDPDSFRATIRRARQLGFSGAFCIHPSQVTIMNEEFVPSAEEVAHAEGLLAAFENGKKAGKGAVEYQGKMIDPPVVARAEELLWLHKRSSR